MIWQESHVRGILAAGWDRFNRFNQLSVRVMNKVAVVDSAS